MATPDTQALMEFRKDLVELWRSIDEYYLASVLSLLWEWQSSKEASFLTVVATELWLSYHVSFAVSEKLSLTYRTAWTRRIWQRREKNGWTGGTGRRHDDAAFIMIVAEITFFPKALGQILLVENSFKQWADPCPSFSYTFGVVLVRSDVEWACRMIVGGFFCGLLKELLSSDFHSQDDLQWNKTAS